MRIGTDREINAFGGGNAIQINLALAELLNDSPSELAFAIGHELGHVYQNRVGGLVFYPGNSEFDADVFGLAAAMSAGYDPYGAAGALAKLAMANGRAGLITQFEDQVLGDAHKSFNSRLENMYSALQLACSGASAVCSSVKSIIHPHFPPDVPLIAPPKDPVVASPKPPARPRE